MIFGPNLTNKARWGILLKSSIVVIPKYFISLFSVGCKLNYLIEIFSNDGLFSLTAVFKVSKLFLSVLIFLALRD